jgi:hypothetical protein
MGEIWANKVDTIQFPMPVAKAQPRALICMGMISLMYTQLIGPNEREKMTETVGREELVMIPVNQPCRQSACSPRNKKNTPPIE